MRVCDVVTADAAAQQAFLAAYAEYLPRPLADLMRERLPELLVVRNPLKDAIAPLPPSILEEVGAPKRMTSVQGPSY
jgi:hypothetical protein